MKSKFLSSSKIKVSLNKRELLKDIFSRGGATAARMMNSIIQEKAERARVIAAQEFSQHPVTTEIDAGPSASNSSGLLGGDGTLFSFIGFNAGDNPTQAIKQILENKIAVSVRSIGLGKFNVAINGPSEDEIFAVTPIPWLDGASWALGIEKGISGLGNYLFSSHFKTSRSGEGIQKLSSIRGGKMKTSPYITEILQKLRTNITR